MSRLTRQPYDKSSILRTNGWSTHSEYSREPNDFYSTDPSAIDCLLKYEDFDENIWECACGNGVLSKRLIDYGHTVYSTDKYYRGYGSVQNFLTVEKRFNGDIITNPPYKLAFEFVNKALELTNRKVAMFLRLQFIESQKRYAHIFKKNPPKKIMPFVKRINCYRNDDRSLKGSTVSYAWFIWDKEYDGNTTIEWIDNRGLIKDER